MKKKIKNKRNIYMYLYILYAHINEIRNRKYLSTKTIYKGLNDF